MRKGGLSKNPVMFFLFTISICCVFVLFVTVLKLPDARVRNSSIVSRRPKKVKAKSEDQFHIGKMGEMMIDMLPQDLEFTVFMPSEKAFERDLKLHWNDSLVGEKKDDTYAILTRILGFSAVPRLIYSEDLVYGEEVNYDSISGYILYVLKDSGDMLVVNRVKSEQIDLKRGKIVVHLMDGVIMDPEFEESVTSDDIEEH